MYLIIFLVHIHIKYVIQNKCFYTYIADSYMGLQSSLEVQLSVTETVHAIAISKLVKNSNFSKQFFEAKQLKS